MVAGSFSSAEAELLASWAFMEVARRRMVLAWLGLAAASWPTDAPRLEGTEKVALPLIVSRTADW